MEYRSQILEGQKSYNLRCEPLDHPCNTIEVPASVTLYIGENFDVPRKNGGRFVAFIEMSSNPGKIGIVNSGSTMTEV
jgi:hypothetical protein